jgi:glycosyltransferase involved in cell wall biosynthesis
MSFATSRSPRVTVVVCSLNGGRKIAACLEALANQSVAGTAQVVVVDDGSTDATAEVARRYTQEVVVHSTNRGLSAARNTGIEHARAPVIAFTDDDCIPAPTWLEQLLLAHERPGVVGAGGPVEVAELRTAVHRYLLDNPPLAPLELELGRCQSLPGRFGLYLRRMWAPANDQVGRAVYSFAGANMSFKKAALFAVGGFDPRQKFGGDDEYICSRIRGSFPSSKLWFEPSALVRHNYEGTLRDLARRNYAYGRGHAWAYLEDPSRRWPVFFPFPLALLGFLYAWRPRRVLGLPLAVHFLYPQGAIGAIKHRRPANLAFSWFRLVEESAHDVGLLLGLFGRGSAPSTGRHPCQGYDHQ